MNIRYSLDFRFDELAKLFPQGSVTLARKRSEEELLTHLEWVEDTEAILTLKFPKVLSREGGETRKNSPNPTLEPKWPAWGLDIIPLL